MEFLIFFVISVIISFFCLFNMRKMSIVTMEDIKIKKAKNDSDKNSKLTFLVLTMITCFLMSYLSQVLIYRNVDYFAFAKLCMLYAVIVSAAVIDFKLTIIPNYLIAFGFAARVVVYIVEFIFAKNVKQTIISDLIGFALGFGVFAIVSVITKQALGFGDAKLFAVIGLTLGSFGTYSVMFTSVFVSAIISIALLIFKKKGRKDSIPFGPCIYIGYVLTLCLGSY